MATTVDDVANLARDLLDAEASVAEAEAALKARKEKVRLLSEETLPNMLLELGITELKLDSGHKVTVGQEVYASLPKDPAKRAEAMQYLVDHEASGLIKTEVSVSLGKEQWDLAVKLTEELEGQGYSPVLEQNIHPQTLKAYIRERIAEGEAIDLNILGATAVMTAKVKETKNGKAER